MGRAGLVDVTGLSTTDYRRSVTAFDRLAFTRAVQFGLRQPMAFEFQPRAGCKAKESQSTKCKALIEERQGHQETQIYLGGGQHGGGYLVVSRITEGLVKLAPATIYGPIPGENAKILGRPSKRQGQK